MKKAMRIFSFLFVLAFCFTSMTLNVFAISYQCDQHPTAYWYGEPHVSEHGGYYHEIICSVCDQFIDVEKCYFVTMFDCTKPTYCCGCGQSKAGEAEHDFTILYKTDANKHYYACSNDDSCEVPFIDYHHYEVIDGVLKCAECGRQAQ